MELQLGKITMGFLPAAVSRVWVVSKWQEMDDFTNRLQHASQSSHADQWWHFYWLERWQKKKKKKNNCESGFHICKLRVLISLGCFVNNGEPIWCQGSKHWIATLRGARFLSASFVSFDVGSQSDYHMCVHAKDSICELFYLFVYFYCDSILLLFWAQSTVHMTLAALWMANVSVTVKPIRQDWEVWETEGWKSLWQKERCGDKSKEGTIIYWALTFCLLSDAAGM